LSKTKFKGGRDIKKNEIRVNEEIRCPKVRVIDPDGNQLGILSTKEAILKATNYDLDLVEVAPNASPPVCRIMDYGKYKYQQSKKEKESKKKQHVIHIKEIRLRPMIDTHDIEFKMRQARKFIESGNHLRIRILYRGRQIVHPELGQAILERVELALEDIAKLESKPVQEGRSLVATFIHK
jgi:translation initiation factor IF-3